MTTYARGLLEGFLLAHNAPKRVMEAMDEFANPVCTKNAAVECQQHTTQSVTPPSKGNTGRRSLPLGVKDERISTVRNYLDDGMKAGEIADKMGITEAAFYNFCKRHQIKITCKKQETESRLARMREFAGEKTQSQMADALGLTLQVISYLCHRYKVPYKPAPRTGRPKNKGNRKTWRENVERITADDNTAPAMADKVTVTTDENGVRIIKCPPGYARGVPAGSLTGKYSVQSKSKY